MRVNACTVMGSTKNRIKKLNICTKPPKFPPTSIKLKTFLVALIYYDDSYMLYLKRVC